MRNWKVGVRLGIAFALLLSLIVLATGVAVLGLRSAEAQASALERENVRLLDAANAMRVAQLNGALAVRDFVSLPDVESQKLALRALKASEKEYAEAAAALDGVVDGMGSEEMKAEVGKVRRANAPVAARLHEAIDLSESAEYQQAQALVYTEVRPLQAAIGSALQRLTVRSMELARARVQSVRQQAQRTEWLLLSVLSAALVFGIAATWLISRGIVRPLAAMVTAAERVAEGDLTLLRLPASRDETGRVLAAIGAMQARLNALVQSIRDAAQSVDHATARIADGNSDLAARTEEQAASLEETAASMEELAATVKQNSDSAGKASELATTAATLARAGGDAVGGVVASMEGIQRASRKVAAIVGVMDEIAFQTNLLALNAAVEAARAGDHGRGFGVVAAQVRVLAQRSAEAAREIKQLVADSTAQANTGAQAAARASETIVEAVDVVASVAEVVADIAQASREQRNGIEQVHGTLTQLESVTQSNTGLVQEISALTEALLHQARALVAATARFRLEEEAPSGSEQAVQDAARGPRVAWTSARPALS